VTAGSIALFIAAAFAEIGGAYLVWVGIKDHKGVAFAALGAMALTAYGVAAAFQPSHEFGRVLAALLGFEPNPGQAGPSTSFALLAPALGV
jgi:small multidrug resistance family-3 protein